MEGASITRELELTLVAPVSVIEEKGKYDVFDDCILNLYLGKRDSFFNSLASLIFLSFLSSSLHLSFELVSFSSLGQICFMRHLQNPS